MTKAELIQHMRDVIGPNMAELLAWETDESFEPAYRTTLRRMDVTSPEAILPRDEEEMIFEATYAIWAQVRNQTTHYHYITNPDGVSAQLQQVHTQAIERTADAYMYTRDYGVGVEDRVIQS